jgi:hypothetical protein
MSGAKFCSRPLLGGGGGGDDDDVDEEDEVAGKAAETLGRFAMQVLFVPVKQVIWVPLLLLLFKASILREKVAAETLGGSPCRCAFT